MGRASPKARDTAALKEYHHRNIHKQKEVFCLCLTEAI